MLFLREEINLLHYSLRTTDKIVKGRTPEGEFIDTPEARKFEELTELPLAIGIMNKLKPALENPDKEYELDFTTEEKSALLRYAKRSWSLGDGEFYLSVKKKLE